MPKDGGGHDDDFGTDNALQEEASIPRTAVLVTDADNRTADQVVLQLILARCVSHDNALKISSER